MATESAPQESVRPKERPTTPEFQAQVERRQLESQVGRELLSDEVNDTKIQTVVVSGLGYNHPSHYSNVGVFNPSLSEQYLPDSISQDRLERLKIDRDTIIEALEHGITKSYNHNVAPGINIESGEVEGFLGMFFTTEEQVGEYYYGSAYYQAQEFNHKIVLLPESIGILPIDISADTL